MINRLMIAAAVIALVGCGNSSQPDKSDTKTANDTAMEAPQRWRLVSTFPSSLPLLGTAGLRLESEIPTITDGAVEVEFFNPGVLVPAFEAFDAVSVGAIEASWSTSGYWAGKIPALNIFSAVPFGPSAPEYLGWYDFGGGRELFEELYHRHNIHPIVCGMLPPESAGWYKQAITSPADYKGMKIRFFGLGGKVLEKLGAAPQLIAGGEIFQALELGAIDATEYSMPAVDERLGFSAVASHYYFPGWHQQSTLFELLIHKPLWDELSTTRKKQIQAVCSENIRYNISEGEAAQPQALANIAAKGTKIESLPPEVLDALKIAWDEVATELATNDKDFARVWKSLSDFRETYKIWSKRGYLRPKD